MPVLSPLSKLFAASCSPRDNSRPPTLVCHKPNTMYDSWPSAARVDAFLGKRDETRSARATISKLIRPFRVVGSHRSTSKRVKGYRPGGANESRRRFINASSVSRLSTPIAKPLRNDSTYGTGREKSGGGYRTSHLEDGDEDRVVHKSGWKLYLSGRDYPELLPPRRLNEGRERAN